MTTAPTPPGRFGPERRRGALAVAVDLAHPDATPGAVATLLDVLDRRGVPSTWFSPPGTDPALLDRLWFTGHEAAALVASTAELDAALAATASHDTPVVGARVTDVQPDDPAALVALARGHGLTHLSVPTASAAVLAAEAVSDAEPVVVLGAGAGPGLAIEPDAWLAAAQVGLGRAVQHGALFVLRVDPVALDRPGALGRVVEAVDLAAGLVRAERLHADRLDRLVADLAGFAGFAG